MSPPMPIDWQQLMGTTTAALVAEASMDAVADELQQELAEVVIRRADGRLSPNGIAMINVYLSEAAVVTITRLLRQEAARIRAEELGHE